MTLATVILAAAPALGWRVSVGAGIGRCCRGSVSASTGLRQPTRPPPGRERRPRAGQRAAGGQAGPHGRPPPCSTAICGLTDGRRGRCGPRLGAETAGDRRRLARVGQPLSAIGPVTLGARRRPSGPPARTGHGGARRQHPVRRARGNPYNSMFVLTGRGQRWPASTTNGTWCHSANSRRVGCRSPSRSCRAAGSRSAAGPKTFHVPGPAGRSAA